MIENYNFLQVGKLKLRLSTIAPDKVHTSVLPLVADRKSGGKKAASAHIHIQVHLAQSCGYYELMRLAWGNKANKLCSMRCWLSRLPAWSALRA